MILEHSRKVKSLEAVKGRVAGVGVGEKDKWWAQGLSGQWNALYGTVTVGRAEAPDVAVGSGS